MPLASEPERLAGLARLEIRALTAVEGLTGGQHHSSLHGASTTFAQHRAYVPGDDLRHLDWKLMARSDRNIVRQYEEETDLTAAIVVDASASMNYSSLAWSKWEYATWLAAALTQLLWMQNDKCALGISGNSGLQEWLPPRRGDAQRQNVFQALEQTQAQGGDDGALALESCLEKLTKRGLVIWIGDCLGNPQTMIQAAAKVLHRGHDLIVLRILDPAEIDFPFGRSTRFLDLEGEDSLIADPRAIRLAYLEEFENHAQELRLGLRSLNADFLRLPTDLPFEVGIRKLLSKRTNRHRRAGR